MTISNQDLVTPSNVAVIGLGYVGLPTAALFASNGISTLGVDINANLVGNLRVGEFLPKEPGLHDLIVKGRENNFLDYSSELSSRDAYIIAVPTPINLDKTPGLQHVMSAVEAISKVLEPGQLVILESTSPPGSTRMIAQKIHNMRPDLDVSGVSPSSVLFAYCPERVLPGNALHEIVNNERLIGGMTPRAAEVAQKLYKLFAKGATVLCTDAEAEMAKLIENSFRDVNIAFANEISRVASKLGIDAKSAIALANRHPRVNILSPGVGVGGHCISVDPWFVVHAAPEDTNLVRTAREVNDRQPKLLALEVLDILEEGSHDEVYCLGLTYKPNSDDLRESPSLIFADWLKDLGLKLPLHLIDPVIDDHQVNSLKSKFHSVSNTRPDFGSRALVLLLVEHNEFQDWNLENLSTIRISGTGQIRKLSAVRQ